MTQKTAKLKHSGRRRSSQYQTTKPTLPSVALRKEYQRKLGDMIKRMNKSVTYWLTAEFKRQCPELAQDILPSRALSDKLKKVMRKWRREFNADAEEIAGWFVGRNLAYVKRSIRKAMEDAGIIVHMRTTRAERNVINSLVIENVNLIKTIPEQYFSQVESLVQTAVQNGRDLGFLTEELAARYDITYKRAVTISRDQSNKATEQLAMTRHKALGVTQGIWIHTSGSKTYRSTHVAMNGKLFNLDEGLYDSQVGHNVLPAECVNCKCTYKPILPVAVAG